MNSDNSDNTDNPSPGVATEEPPQAQPGNEGNEPAEVSDNTPAVEADKTIRIVAIKFRDAGKLYDFDARNFELTNDMQVVVETDRGKALGTVVLEPRETPADATPDGLKGVLRIANDKDIESAERHVSREAEALKFCRQKAAERNMEMKLVKAEYLFDGSKIIFYFTADGRVDFRELVKDLAHHFHTRIEMRQIGVRDEAKLIGGIGVCGRELCCCSFLREFDPVSVKMAKEQGLALNPSKISGQCGRLLCCLGYEYETYCCLKKGLPKCGRKVKIGEETVEVTQIDLLKQKVTIRHDDESIETVDADIVRHGTVEHPPQGGKQKTERQKTPPREQARSSERQKDKPVEKRKEPENEKPSSNENREATQDKPAEGERKRKRRPRRRRKNRRNDGQAPPNKPEKT